MNCPDCYIRVGVFDLIGAPKGAYFFVCPDCGQVFSNSLGEEYLAGRFNGEPEFWMNENNVPCQISINV